MLTFCKIRKNQTTITSQGIDIQYFKNINEVDEYLWNEAAPADDVFLQYDYLHLLEQFPPDSGSFAYVLFSKNDIPLGVAYFQIGYFDAAKSIHSAASWKKWIASQVNFRALILGNALLTGEHAYFFSPKINQKTKETLINEAITMVENQCAIENRKVSFHLIKDFYEPQQNLLDTAYSPFPFSPNMVLNLSADWKVYDDYLNAMTTKYRTRAKRAEKKREGLKFLELDAEMIDNQQDVIYQLYNKVANDADFNYTFLHKNYFAAMKRTFGDTFRMFGCYAQNELVGFFTTTQNYDELETGFIGFQDAYNHSHQIYLNFLYEMVKIGIETGVKRVVFSRTALEIKSSIGAEPYMMQTYLKHPTPFLNYFMPRVVKAISPTQEWQQRKPFKD